MRQMLPLVGLVSALAGYGCHSQLEERYQSGGSDSSRWTQHEIVQREYFLGIVIQTETFRVIRTRWDCNTGNYVIVTSGPEEVCRALEREVEFSDGRLIHNYQGPDIVTDGHGNIIPERNEISHLVQE